jgi:sugar/nucleoside kinase (ribokinase family)
VRLPLSLPPSASRSFDVVGFGQNSVDLVAVIRDHPAPDSHVRAERLIRMVGGEVATAVVACARLGCRTRYIGAIGKDDAGAMVEGRLRDEGVDLACVLRVDAQNRFAIILVDAAGRRTVIWHRDHSIERLAGVIDRRAAASGRVLVADASDPEGATVAAAAARAAGNPVLLDVDEYAPRLDALLRSADVVIASASFFDGYAPGLGIGEALRRLSTDTGCAVAIATMGPDGSLALCERVEVRTPAFEVDVVDSTGAGDAFRGGFAASWMRFGKDAPLATLLEYASAVAGLNCGALGAQTGLPLWPDVDALVARQGRG